MLRLAVRIVGLVVGLVVLYVAVTFTQVVWASRQDERPEVSAIVVLGAAQWNGTPSPVLQARLDHAVALYEAGVAPLIVVTGGKQEGDAVTEGYASLTELLAQGVPEEAIRVEVSGSDTYEQLAATAGILEGEGIGPTVVVVSSPYHAYRSGSIAEEVGMRAHVSPSGDSAGLADLWRETVAVAVGRIIGYRRLSNLS